MTKTFSNDDPAKRSKLGVDSALLDLLVCPLTKGPLTVDEESGTLISEKAKLAYPVRDGIPILLPSEAQEILDDGPVPPQPDR